MKNRLLFIVLLIFFVAITQCNNNDEQKANESKTNITNNESNHNNTKNSTDLDKLNEKLMPNGFESLKFGMDFNEVYKELEKHSIELTKSVMEGGEILIFIQNTTRDITIINGIINYINSGKFSSDNPLSKVLPDITIYTLNIEKGESYHLINTDWSPVELYFFRNKFFAMSGNVGKSLDGKRVYKNKVIDMYDEGIKIDSDEFSTIYEDSHTYMNINVADSLYLYDKDNFRQVLAYVKAKLNIL
jgi:hypothetical protein